MRDTAICGICGGTLSRQDDGMCAGCGGDDWIQLEDMGVPVLKYEQWEKLIRLITRGPKIRIMDLNLCEQNHLILRPNRLYRFTVDEKCPACLSAAQHYKEEE